MLNKTIIQGRLTKDPVLKKINDVFIANITLAVERRYNKDETDFINVTLWRKTAEFVNQYFKKGMQMIVSGRIESGSYENDSKEKVYFTKVVGEDVYFSGSKNKLRKEDINGEPPF